MIEKKEDMKRQIDVMTEKEYDIFYNDAVRGKFLREWCPRCDDFETCDKTADKLDDCMMQAECDFKDEEQARREL